MFANVRLPLTIGEGKDVEEKDMAEVLEYFFATAASPEFDTYLQTYVYKGSFWTRFCAQVYLGMEDFEWGAQTILEICKRIREGRWTV